MDTLESPVVLRTERLAMRRFVPGDAPFALELLNDPEWIRNIGDRGVRTVEQARAYLAGGPIALCERHGFGLYLVSLREDGRPIGMCGLVRRAGLADPDVGFAFLPAWRGRGFALEAARAVLEHGRRDFGLERIVAIVSEHNAPSMRVLEKLGMRAGGRVRLPPADEDVLLYEWPATSGAR